ncbi:MAG: hypothetical protein J5I50_09195 [Chitinophagaceae bacterium]|nr:hypothetical protein [Chitinophagaceae bacterium]
MKPIKLLPHRFKAIGWIVLIPSALIGLLILSQQDGFLNLSIPGKIFAVVNNDIFEDPQYFTIIKTDLLATLLGALVTLGALIVAFSAEKEEDEFIAALRLSSFQWAVLVSYGILLFCFLFIFGLAFFTAMAINMFTVIFLFIIRFNYLLYKNKHLRNEE